MNRHTPWRTGMVGAGYMAKLHSLSMNNLAGLSQDPRDRFELVRIVDTDLAAAEQEAGRWGWKAFGDDWRQVTRSADIDVVSVATPNDLHHEICLDAFRHGKHVLCEKPLATSARSALELAQAAHASGRVHRVNFTYRSWPAIAQAKALISQGAIGAVRHFEGHFFQDHNNDPTIPLHWRFRQGPAGAGALGDVGAHIIDLARFLVGEVDSVVATTQRFIDQRPLPQDRQRQGAVEVDDLACALVQFRSGASGTLKASWALPGYKNDVYFVVVGEHGAIRFSWERSNELQVFDSADAAPLSGYRTIPLGRAHPGAELFWFPALGGEQDVGVTAQGMGYGDAFVLGFRDFSQALRQGESPAPNFVDGLRCSEITDAILTSARERCWIDVDHAPVV